MTAYYAYPEATATEMKTIVISGEGVSPRDVRQDAELKVEQTMDLSVLSTVLISEDTAEHNIYEYLDIYFRDANSPITSKMAIIQGDLKPFFELSENKQSTAGEFYDRFITSLEDNSFVIPYTLQTASTVISEDAQDLALPYLKMGEDNRPKAEGVALFSGKSFTGKTLNADEGLLLSILNDSLGFSTRIAHLYKDSPLTVRVNKLKRKLNITENKIVINLKIDFMLSEFPQDNIDNANLRKELEKFLQAKIEQDLNEVIKKLQEAKSDAIGLGRSVRAFHPEWFKKDWNERFSELDISAKLKVEIVKTGILE
ncbi:hypothetical protein SSIL_2546 [Solibacillus silvestris StLB046]|uniref:Uncharacterized protein n=1 Tax=Solibacillus silvestris (strain StLB046) TaxID=1002809 RepID=F2F504_SOLSS|nr:hypothetical protein SSIL_2546 [Solibacillus silvestris StLB046]